MVSVSQAVLKTESTLTDRYQTTVPDVVRRALGLNKRDKIHYIIRPNGEVVLQRAEVLEHDEDPVLAAFLQFLARDVSEHPEHLRALDVEHIQHLHELTKNVEVHLDEPLSPDDE